MKKQQEKTKTKSPDTNKKKNEIPTELPGYPLYPSDEDIYNNFEKVDNIDLDDMSKIKKTTKKKNPDMKNEKDFDEDMSGDDLDIPGSELDDQEEEIGSEDEENNYYSLGGDKD